MGHFGKGPVRIAWFSLVWPALVLNYFGQGALVLRSPAALHKPLFSLVPVAVLPALVPVSYTHLHILKRERRSPHLETGSWRRQTVRLLRYITLKINNILSISPDKD